MPVLPVHWSWATRHACCRDWLRNKWSSSYLHYSECCLLRFNGFNGKVVGEPWLSFNKVVVVRSTRPDYNNSRFELGSHVRSGNCVLSTKFPDSKGCIDLALTPYVNTLSRNLWANRRDTRKTIGPFSLVMVCKTARTRDMRGSPIQWRSSGAFMIFSMRAFACTVEVVTDGIFRLEDE